MSTSTSAFSNNRIQSLGMPRKAVTMSEPEYNWGEAITQKLDELINLEQGWDGYNACPVSFANASFAQALLKEICNADTPPPQIVPGTDGDLQIEWHIQDIDIELHVVQPYNVRFWTNDEQLCPNGNEVQLTTVYNVVLPVIRKLTELAHDQSAAA